MLTVLDGCVCAGTALVCGVAGGRFLLPPGAAGAAVFVAVAWFSLTLLVVFLDFMVFPANLHFFVLPPFFDFLPLPLPTSLLLTLPLLLPTLPLLTLPLPLLTLPDFFALPFFLAFLPMVFFTGFTKGFPAGSTEGVSQVGVLVGLVGVYGSDGLGLSNKFLPVGSRRMTWFWGVLKPCSSGVAIAFEAS
eukprot:s1799_g8.t1